MKKKSLLRIATRKSALALWQANYIKQGLEQAYPQLKVELLAMTTSGDQQLNAPLSAAEGGKGLFVKELELALLAGTADIAVHSMKDVPMDFPAGLMIGAISERADPRDVFVSKHYKKLIEVPIGGVIGTSSLRRTCQLHALRADLNMQLLRGNVDTRLRRLEEDNFAGIILAAAGLHRLGLTDRISEYLSPDICLPAVGQGALGIECRSADHSVREMIKIFDHVRTHVCVRAERALNARLQGGCQVPVAAYAVVLDDEEDQISLRGLVGQPDGSVLLRTTVQGKYAEAENIGIQAAENLLEQGAAAILKAQIDSCKKL